MKRTLFCICTLLAAAACEQRDRQPESQQPAIVPPAATGTPTTPSPSTPSPSADERRPVSGIDQRTDMPMNAPASADERADNTGRNERDRSGATTTSGDQSENEADRSLTQRVRQAVMDDESLSSSAKNAKIMSRDGVVTLRGPVQSSQEKTKLAAIAQKTDGVKRVDNQLEIAAK
jgi:osmotically-inducible protein OsmY